MFFSQIFPVLIFISISLVARADNKECYLYEIDPHTKKVYQNRAQWEADRKALWNQTPEMPDILSLQAGYAVGVRESARSKGMGSDKRKHCYVGCRIAAEVSYEVAVYAAYYKENRDISDCDPNSRFEWEDIAATERGAKIAQKQSRPSPAFCRERCRAEFK